MQHRLGMYSVLFGCSLWFLGGGVARAQGCADSWYLYKVTSGYEQAPTGEEVSYEMLRADGTGGQVRVRVRCGHRDQRMLQYIYDWRFDQDISRVRPNQRIIIHATGRREDQLLELHPPREWVPTFYFGTDSSGSPHILAKIDIGGLADAMTTWREFNSRHRGRIYCEDCGNQEPTSGEAELRVLGNACCNTSLQFRIDAGGAQIAVAYVYKALLQGEAPPDQSPPPDQGPPPNGGGAVPGVRIQTPPPEEPEPFAQVQRTTIQVGQRRVKPGDIVQLPIYLINARNLSNMNVAIHYDPNMLQLAGKVVRGPMLDGFLFETNEVRGATPAVLIAFASSNPISGSGPIAAVPLRVIAQPGSNAGISVEVTQANEPSGAVPVVDQIFGGISVIDPNAGMRGDCDGDGCLDEMDARNALMMSIGKREANLILDMDGDGKVDSRDAQLILQKAAGR